MNAICPGLVDTELLDTLPSGGKESTLATMGKRLLVGHVAGPEEIAEAYLFAMKCAYLTGQRIDVDGGSMLYQA